MKMLFRSKAQLYEGFRPPYQSGCFDKIQTELGIDTSEAKIAEFGAGTGKFTELIPRNFQQLSAIEPDYGMREILCRKFADCPDIKVLPATAEASGLESGSFDLIICAQSFHHFSEAEAPAEFMRIIKPGGKILLVWYFSDLGCKLSKEIQVVFYNYRQRLGQDRRLKIDAERIGQYFSPFPVKNVNLPSYAVIYDWMEFISSMLSSSYAPCASSRMIEEFTQEIGDLFSRFEKNGEIRLDFYTTAYVVYCSV